MAGKVMIELGVIQMKNPETIEAREKESEKWWLKKNNDTLTVA